jgi:hypothetical protein
MSSNKIEIIRPSIEKVFKDIRSHVSGIEQDLTQKERIVNAVCDYVTKTITAESKSLLSTFYTSLMDETLNNEPFLNNTKNKNKFYRKDILSIIFEKYNFSINNNIDYKQAYEKSSSLPVPIGTAGIGIILSIALSNIIILPVSLVIAGGLYFAISEYEKDKNKEDFKSAIDCYLNSVESELYKWFKSIEDFYNKQVEEITSTLEDEKNE